jgi:hypothetical protein
MMQVPSASQEKFCTSPLILCPCHICDRRPITREFLQAYADCGLRGKRACLIFLRRCDTVECCDRRIQEEQQLWRATANGLPPTKAGMLCKTNCLEKYARAPL